MGLEQLMGLERTMMSKCKKIGKRKLLMILLLLLVGSQTVSAIWGLDWVMKHVMSFFFDQIDYILGLPDAWRTGGGLIGLLVRGLTWNPSVDTFRPIADDIIQLLLPVYVLAMIITGFAWLFLSLSAPGRAKAKSMLLKLLVSLIFVSASTAVFQLLLDLSELLVNFIISLAGGIDMTALAAGCSIGSTLIVAYFFPLGILIFSSALFLVFAVRYVLLLFFGAIFPLIIFLFFFQPTHSIGLKFMRWTLVLIFSPALQAFFLVFSLVAMSSDTSGVGNIVIPPMMIGGILLMLISPWIMLGFMKWLGGIFMALGLVSLVGLQEKYGVWGVRASGMIMFGGALMAGEGASAIPLIGTEPFFMVGLEHVSETFAEHRTGIRRLEPAEWRLNRAVRERRDRLRRGRPPKPETPGDYRALAKQMESARNYEKAARYYRKAGDVELAKGNKGKAADDFFNAGRNWERAGNPKEAIRMYERGLRVGGKKHPQAAKYYERIADLYLKRG